LKLNPSSCGTWLSGPNSLQQSNVCYYIKQLTFPRIFYNTLVEKNGNTRETGKCGDLRVKAFRV